MKGILIKEKGGLYNECPYPAIRFDCNGTMVYQSVHPFQKYLITEDMYGKEYEFEETICERVIEDGTTRTAYNAILNLKNKQIKKVTTHVDSYETRLSGHNFAEEEFEKHCKENGYEFLHLGFDTNNPIPNFSDINPLLRNLPDYLIWRNGVKSLVQVKGTNKFKESEYKLLDELNSIYGSHKVKIYYWFTTKEGKCFYTLQGVKQMYENIKEVSYFAENKPYKELNLFNDKKN